MLGQTTPVKLMICVPIITGDATFVFLLMKKKRKEIFGFKHIISTYRSEPNYSDTCVCTNKSMLLSIYFHDVSSLIIG